MGFERRAVLAGGLLLMAGCARAAPPPAPRRSPSAWDEFKRRFVLPEGRIADTGNGGISHSEGQGYGLVLAEAAGDRATFDRLLGWTEATLATD
ncbi:MAG: glycosyl hydrolase family 8, partial [Rhizorhabdus sp.]